FVIITGYIVEGLRIAVTELASHPEWAIWSPGGYIFARAFSGLDESSARILHRSFWWFHAILVDAAFIYVALSYSKLQHIIISPLNAFFRNLGPVGVPSPINFKSAENLSVGEIKDFTWKQLLDLDACTNCGRCQDACPAYLTGKPLSPRKLVQDLKAQWLKTAQFKARASKDLPPLVGGAVTEGVLWACTTCAACMETCPVFVEHVPGIVDMRRELVQMKAKFPEELLSFFENMEQRSNPWGIAPGDRAKWASELDVKHFEAGTEYLFYVGCYGAFDARSRRVSAAVANILNRAGISWGILGKDELCCGDSLRRLGNEYVFDQMVKANIKLFADKGIKKLITQCPHCFSTFKNDYRQYGIELEVIHHTEFIEQLLRDNRLKLNGAVDLGNIVFHDSCYLGRYNQIYQAPRHVISAVTGQKPLEMKRHRKNSFCCGAGGGRMWLEESTPQKIYQARTEEALEHSPSAVCVCCPYCMTMFEDGLKDKGALGRVNVLDLAEIVERALQE
ncbi:MAG: (Fe-S)-binding protein, partial [Chloroflexi bacterium]|nr:(Fe-S)-binding protein [Chloroflexota bacterium]